MQSEELRSPTFSNMPIQSLNTSMLNLAKTKIFDLCGPLIALKDIKASVREYVILGSPLFPYTEGCDLS